MQNHANTYKACIITHKIIFPQLPPWPSIEQYLRRLPRMIMAISVSQMNTPIMQRPTTKANPNPPTLYIWQFSAVSGNWDRQVSMPISHINQMLDIWYLISYPAGFRPQCTIAFRRDAMLERRESPTERSISPLGKYSPCAKWPWRKWTSYQVVWNMLQLNPSEFTLCAWHSTALRVSIYVIYIYIDIHTAAHLCTACNINNLNVYICYVSKYFMILYIYISMIECETLSTLAGFPCLSIGPPMGGPQVMQHMCWFLKSKGQCNAS